MFTSGCQIRRFLRTKPITMWLGAVYNGNGVFSALLIRFVLVVRTSPLALRRPNAFGAMQRDASSRRIDFSGCLSRCFVSKTHHNTAAAASSEVAAVWLGAVYSGRAKALLAPVPYLVQPPLQRSRRGPYQFLPTTVMREKCRVLRQLCKAALLGPEGMHVSACWYNKPGALKASKITFHTDKNCLLDPRRSTFPLSVQVRRVGWGLGV